MDVRVIVRFNSRTGEMERFDVEDEGGERPPQGEHDRVHERIAAEIGSVLERFPRLSELHPDDPLVVTRAQEAEPAPEPDGQSVTQPQRRRAGGGGSSD